MVTISITAADPINSINIKTSKNIIEAEPPDEKHHVHKILGDILDSLINKTDPYEEFQQLLSCYDFRETLVIISGENTLYTIDCFFSKRSNLFKILTVNQYSKKIEERKQDSNINLLEDKVIEIINDPPESIDYLYNISEINLSPYEIDQLYIQFNDYFQKNLSLNKIISDLQIDCLLIFIIAMVIWGFCYSAVALSFPEIFSIVLCYSEALIVGVSSSALLAQISIIENMANSIIEKIPFIGVYLNSNALEAAISSLVCIVILGVFIFLFESSMVIKLIASGAGFLAPPLILFILCMTSIND